MAVTPLPFEHPEDELGARLLEAAAEVFAERGYDKAGVAEIARRAGVTTGAIYSRYRGKAELLVDALDAHTPDEFDALFADHRFQGRMEDILRIAGSHLVERPGTGHPELLLEAFVAARRNPEVADLLRTRLLERRQRLEEVIAAAKASGGIEADIDTDSLVAFCHAVGFGFLVFDAVSLPLPDTAPWTDLIARLVDAVGPDAALTPTRSFPTPPSQKEG